MTMQLADAATGGGGGPRRRWAAGLAAATLVAAAGGIGFGIGYAIGDDGSDRIAGSAGEATGEATDTGPANDAVTTDQPPPMTLATAGSTAGGSAEPTTTEAIESSGAEPVPTDVSGGTSSAGTVVLGPEMDHEILPRFGAPMDVVYSRTTDAGLTLRVQRGERWGPPPSELGNSGWVPPGWCQPSGQLRVSLTGGSVVDVAWLSWFDEQFEGRTVQLITVGFADGAPHRVLVVETDSGFDTVTARFPDGAGDTTSFVDGIAVLAVPSAGFDPSPDSPFISEDYELVFGADGLEETVTSNQLGGWQNPAFAATCDPPPPALPPAGEQPTDPDAAEAEIFAAMAALYGDGLDDNSIYLDDPTGVSEARQQVRDGGFETEAASAEAIIEELVFTAPEEAWFRYRIETVGIDLADRYGVAVVIDGTWRITRGTICQDLAMAGGDCGDWDPIILPTT